MFNKKMQYSIKTVPSEETQALQDLLNKMSSEGWDLYTMHEQEFDEGFKYSCIFMREYESEAPEVDFDEVVNVRSFKNQMEKMLSAKLPPYESCKEIQSKIRDQKKKISKIKSQLEQENLAGSEKQKLNEQISEGLKKLESLKKDLVKELSPDSMFSKIKENKFVVCLSDQIIDFVSPDNKDDLLSETVKIREKLTNDIGYVIPKIIFQDDDNLDEYEFSIKIHALEVLKAIAIPNYIAFYKDDLNITKKPKETVSTVDFMTNRELWWIPKNLAKDFWANGMSPVEYIGKAIEFISVKYVQEILDYNDINKYISNVYEHDAFAVNSILPDFISVAELKYLITNLIRERVSVKDIVYIFEKINDFSDEPSKEDLLDKIRLSLSKYITRDLCTDNKINVFEFSPKTLDKLFLITDETMDETVVRVDGVTIEKLVKKIMKKAKTLNLDNITLLVPLSIRHMMFTVFSEFINNLTVIAQEELSCDCEINVLAEI